MVVLLYDEERKKVGDSAMTIVFKSAYIKTFLPSLYFIFIIFLHGLRTLLHIIKKAALGRLLRNKKVYCIIFSRTIVSTY